MENPDHRCSKCAYWQNRRCVVLGVTKNDSICTCGQFSKRKTEDD